MNLQGVSSGLTVTARQFPTNLGGLCQKGWTATELLSHPERLLSPLMRLSKGAELRPVSWDQAFARITQEIRAIQQQFGPDAVGVFGGGGLTNEKAYLLGKFARVALRTSQIDYNGRFCMSSAAAASIKAFGVDRGLPFPLTDIRETKAILLIGSNVAETMPPIMQHFDAQAKNGGSLIVVDPRATKTAQAASLHLQITPGTDAALANGLLHIAIKEGYLDRDFIAERTTGFERVRQIALSYWPERVERMTGIPEKLLVQAAKILGQAPTAMILTARGPEQQSNGVDNVLAFINLALALGKVAKPNCGYGCLTGQGNGQGGREHGQKADQLPGYRKLDNPEHRAHIAKVWGVPENELPMPGCSAYELLDQLGTQGGVRALLVFDSNPAISVPRAGHIQGRLDALDFLVVTDFFLSETAERADVVLPSAQWAEEEGTMTNLEGRVLYRGRATPPPVCEPICKLLPPWPSSLAPKAASPATPAMFLTNCALPLPAALRIMPASPTNAFSAKMASSGRAPAKIIPALRAYFKNASVRPMAARGFIASNSAAAPKSPTPNIRSTSQRGAFWRSINQEPKRAGLRN